MMLIAVWTAQPVLAAGPTGSADDPREVDVATVDGQRLWIAAELIALGRAPDAALEAASRLTAEDLAVLLANPRMIQAAGASNRVLMSIIIGALIIAGLIALAASGDGFVMINN
jgi:hypothetical protein